MGWARRQGIDKATGWEYYSVSPPTGYAPVDSSPPARGLLRWLMNAERVIAYIDGFNLYHAIDGIGAPHLKWVDLWGLAGSYLRDGQALAAVNYYSAYATWLPAAYARHRQYTSALSATGVNVVMSEFKKRIRGCKSCGDQWESHEEKETDVHMAVDIVADALEGNCELAIVVTADSDLKPAIAKVRATTGRRLLMLAPPGRMKRSRDLRPNREIDAGRISRHLLPQQVFREGQVAATRPPQYDPPA